MHRWSEDPNIVGGRDIVGGGACLALNIATGNIAILTNYCELAASEKFIIGKKSRGDIVRDFVTSDFYLRHPDLTKDTSASKHLTELRDHIKDYNPSNVIYGNIHSLEFYQFDYLSQQVDRLPHNVFIGMSNSGKQYPYAKVTRGLKFLIDHHSSVDRADDSLQIVKKPDIPSVSDADKMNSNNDNLFEVYLNKTTSSTKQTKEVDLDNKFEVFEELITDSMLMDESDMDSSIFVKPYMSKDHGIICGTISTTFIIAHSNGLDLPSLDVREVFY